LAPDVGYIYLGDRLTGSQLRLVECTAVRRADGKCIRGKNGSMLVELSNGVRVVVLGRLLRKKKSATEIKVQS